MNSKPFLLIAGICSSVCLGSLFAQAGAGGSGGSGAGSAGSGSAGTGGAGTAASSATSGSRSTPATAGTTATPAAPNSPGAPADATRGSRASTAPSTGASAGISADSRAAAAEQGSLPPGLSTAPARPGVSPLSGLPVSDLPAVSRGTAPLGPTANVPNADSTAAELEARRRGKAASQINDPAAIAAHPQTNPRIGMGTTVVVPTPPPAPQMEATPPASTPQAGQAWVGGHYSWVGGQWQWTAGSWQRPPQPGAAWIPGSYDATTKRWTEGHWDTTRGQKR